jgi:hypothetical protein
MSLTLRHTFSFLTSLIIHLIILFLISFNILPDYLKINKEIKITLIRTPVSKPSLSGQRKTVNKPVNPSEKQSVNKENIQKNAGIKRPIINMPTMDLNEKIDFNVPKYNTTQTNESIDFKSSGLNALNKEIEKLQKQIGHAGNSKSGVNDTVNDNFFELRGLSNKSRRLVYIPENKGTFKLETDTNLVLSFNIDKNGRPYNVTFVNRSFSEIENIALNFVKQLRFEAVDYDVIDKAEIVLHFKVK